MPRHVRLAIRRLHRNLRHLPTNSLVQMIRAMHAPQEYIDAADINHIVVIDMFELKDHTGSFYEVLNCPDYGTMFHQTWIAHVGDTTGPHRLRVV